MPAESVAEFLRSTKLSIEEIAEQCGVDRSQVYRWRNEDSKPSGDAAFVIFKLMQEEKL